jgi:hypothetical protein
MGVMIGLLGGNEESVKAFKTAIGKRISSLKLDEDALHFTFEDGSKLKLFDDGQTCCEHRYMTSDDDLQSFVGSELVSAEIRDAPAPPPDECGECHEVEFLVVSTSKGRFTVETHNEHNGYYGGFLVRAYAE